MVTALYFSEELGRMLVKKEMLENLASGPFVGLCATFASRKRKTRTLPSS
jgi:hypothetical protein